MTFQMVEEKRDGKYLFLEENQPVVVNLLEDLNQIPAVGKYAQNDRGEQQYWHAFRVTVFTGVEASQKILVGGWRLRKAIREALDAAKNTDDEPRVQITMTYKMERLKTGPKAVKHYEVVVQDSQVPF